MYTRIKNAVLFYGFYAAILGAAWLVHERLFAGIFNAFCVTTFFLIIYYFLNQLKAEEKLRETLDQTKGRSTFDYPSFFDKMSWIDAKEKSKGQHRLLMILDYVFIFFALPGLVIIFEIFRVCEELRKKEGRVE